jgi:uncharacterized Zn finger protein (UPF0148 family)
MADEEGGRVLGLTAQGILMTEIRCPHCGVTFRVDGNVDREVVECPQCDAELCVEVR